MTNTTDLTVLGNTVRNALTADQLEVFPAPDDVTVVKFEVTEFTSICPVTGQPDFGTLTIAYQPDGLCVESKSLKLYLWGYREQGAFCEALASQICHDIADAVVPAWIRVENVQNVRGGIITTSVAEWSQDQEAAL